MDIEELLDIDPFVLDRIEKREFLEDYLNNLTRKHYESSDAYSKMLDSLGVNIDAKIPLEEIPFIPVRLFKLLDLLSVDKEDVIKTMTSSGTSGQAVSKIFLDKITSRNQTKVLTKLVSYFLSKKRLPMIILDKEDILKDRKSFSARGAGILGFSIFGSRRMFALDENMNLKVDEIKAFVDKYKNERILLFGFTFMIYLHFYKELVEKNIKLDLSNGVLIHGGGWKKLEKESISSTLFNKKLNEICGINSVHDYYGMVEQTGSIFIECSEGFLHASNFSDIHIRRPRDFSIAEFGEKGIIQVMSILPESYPGHSLLTEDEGVIYGEDSCKCGKKGKYFKVLGRLKSAEIRGCSDTYVRK